MLIVRVLDVTNDDTATSDQHVLSHVGVQENTSDDLSAEADRVIKLDLAATCDLCLPEGTLSDVWLRRGLQCLRLSLNSTNCFLHCLSLIHI